MRVEGETDRLHVKCTEAPTAFRISGSRKNLLSSMAGTLARDDFGSYSRDENLRHARREAHILRCPQAEMEHEDEGRSEGRLSNLFLLANSEADDARAKGVEVLNSIRDC